MKKYLLCCLWGMPSTTPYRVTSAASSQARGISVSRQKSCRTALYSVSAQDEAAVCLHSQAGGTGVSVQDLYLFELDTFAWTVPDDS